MAINDWPQRECGKQSYHDREALIKTVVEALRSTGINGGLRERAEIVLRAVGLIS